jgi:integrase/recombinase XerC
VEQAQFSQKTPVRRGKRKPPTFLRAPERDALLAAAAADPRDRAVLALFVYGGLRLNELRMLDRADVDLEERTVLIRFAKGGKWRAVRLHAVPEAAIKSYLATRQDNDPALFVSQERRRIGRRTLQTLVEKYVATLALQKHVTVHCLRHTFAVSLLKACKNIRIVQRALGHSKIETTVIYTQIADDELYEAMDGL